MSYFICFLVMLMNNLDDFVEADDDIDPYELVFSRWFVIAHQVFDKMPCYFLHVKYNSRHQTR